jgi:hypothetical protein
MKRKRLLGILFMFVFVLSLSFGFALTVQATYPPGACCTALDGSKGMLKTDVTPYQCLCGGFYVDGVWNPYNCRLLCRELP